MARNQKYQVKESELDAATTEMKEAIASVKALSKSVKYGTISKKELTQAVNELNQKKKKVEFLSAESKMLGGFSTTKEYISNEKGTNILWVLAVATTLYILFVR